MSLKILQDTEEDPLPFQKHPWLLYLHYVGIDTWDIDLYTFDITCIMVCDRDMNLRSLHLRIEPVPINKTLLIHMYTCMRMVKELHS